MRRQLALPGPRRGDDAAAEVHAPDSMTPTAPRADALATSASGETQRRAADWPGNGGRLAGVFRATTSCGRVAPRLSRCVRRRCISSITMIPVRRQRGRSRPASVAECLDGFDGRLMPAG